MHALDLGLFKHHVRRLFKVDGSVKAGGDGASETRPPAIKTVTTKDDKRALQQCLNLIAEEPARPLLLYELLRFLRKVLYTVCVENDIRGAGHDLVVGTRWVLARNIFNWRHSADYNLGRLLSSPTSRSESQQPTPAPDDRENTPAPTTLPASRTGEIDLPLVTRIIAHLTNSEKQEESRRKARSQGSAAVFAYLCTVLEIDHSEIDPKARAAKGKLFDLLIDAIDQDPMRHAMLVAYIPTKSPDRVVLGRDVMEVIWGDMRKTELPTWIRPAPPNWGTTQRGKLSADQYRVICTIHLVVTLIRLWGKDLGRKREMLNHFMDLVSAVRIANLRVTSKQKIEAYNKFIFCYVQGCTHLFPDEDLKPTAHAALHMGDIMDLFGPVHAYSSPFYERYINFFHRMNTNQKLGELESTFMRVSSRASNLRSVLSGDPDLRATVQEMIREIETTEREDSRGYRLASLLDPSAADYVIDSNALPFDIPDDIFLHLRTAIMTSIIPDQAFRLPRQALSVNQISCRGVTYGTSTSSKFKDSKIIFQHSMANPSDDLIAGNIIDIFQHTYEVIDVEVSRVTEFYIVAQEYMPVDATSDPYREFGFSGGFLCRRAPAVASRLIKLSQVVSHFAMTPIDDGEYAGLIHVLPIDRLMLAFSIDSSDAPVIDTDPEEL